jgi:hypothetical protein
MARGELRRLTRARGSGSGYDAVTDLLLIKYLSTAGKKHGVKIESAKNDVGERTYGIAK